MTTTLADVAALVDQEAPFALAYDWDNVGLQIGDPSSSVARVLVALEVNPDVIKFASEHECQAIISHHPLIFKPLRHIRSDTGAAKLVTELIKQGIGLIAAHTNLDRVKQGTNGALADLLELRDCEILEPVSVAKQFKVVVFVPSKYTHKLIDAIHRGGGARIGDYTHCTFRTPGTGTFVPEGDAHPFVGKVGKLEETSEDRLEAFVPESCVESVLQEIRQAHPYEEIAMDVIPLYDAHPIHGLGLVGTVPSKMPLREFARKAREACNENWIQFAGEGKWPVKRVAVITGSAGHSITSINTQRADVVVTGELSYHLVQDAVDRGLGVVALGHAASERVFAPHFCKILQKRAAAALVEFFPYTDFPEPWRLVQKSPLNPTEKKS